MGSFTGKHPPFPEPGTDDAPIDYLPQVSEWSDQMKINPHNVDERLAVAGIKPSTKVQNIGFNSAVIHQDDLFTVRYNTYFGSLVRKHNRNLDTNRTSTDRLVRNTGIAIRFLLTRNVDSLVVPVPVAKKGEDPQPLDIGSLDDVTRYTLLNSIHWHNNTFASVNKGDQPLYDITGNIDISMAEEWGKGERFVVFRNYRDTDGDNKVGLENFTLPAEAVTFNEATQIDPGDVFEKTAEEDSHVALGMPGTALHNPTFTLQVKTTTPPQSENFTARGAFVRTIVNFYHMLQMMQFTAQDAEQCITVNGEQFYPATDTNFLAGVIRNLEGADFDEPVLERPYAAVFEQDEFDSEWRQFNNNLDNIQNFAGNTTLE